MKGKERDREKGEKSQKSEKVERSEKSDRSEKKEKDDHKHKHKHSHKRSRKHKRSRSKSISSESDDEGGSPVREKSHKRSRKHHSRSPSVGRSSDSEHESRRKSKHKKKSKKRRHHSVGILNILCHMFTPFPVIHNNTIIIMPCMPFLPFNCSYSVLQHLYVCKQCIHCILQPQSSESEGERKSSRSTGKRKHEESSYSSTPSKKQKVYRAIEDTCRYSGSLLLSISLSPLFPPSLPPSSMSQSLPLSLPDLQTLIALVKEKLGDMFVTIATTSVRISNTFHVYYCYTVLASFSLTFTTE